MDRHFYIADYCQTDLYTLPDYSQQNTPNESQDVGLLRVAHPQHRLNGEIVKVLKQAGKYWIIEGPDGNPERLPLAWVEPVSPIIAQPNQSETWVGVTELLNLVKMMQRLRGQPPEEVEHESPSSDDDREQCPAGEPNPSPGAHTGVAAIPAGEAGRTDPDPGRNAGQAGTGSAGEA